MLVTCTAATYHTAHSKLSSHYTVGHVEYVWNKGPKSMHVVWYIHVCHMTHTAPKHLMLHAQHFANVIIIIHVRI